jgi:LacI family transcriptional regulator
MSKEKMSKQKKTGAPAARDPGQKVSLKFLANYLGLSPAALSLVLNRSAVADSIPKTTQDEIFAAARKFHYRPNFMARSLRTQRSFTIGVLVPEVSEGYETLVLGGVEEHLLREGYFYFVASHHHRPDLIDEYPRLLVERAVEGLIAVDTPWHHDLSIPVVTVSGHNGVQQRDQHRARSPPRRGVGIGTPVQARTPARSLYQGSRVQFGYGSTLGRDSSGGNSAWP